MGDMQLQRILGTATTWLVGMGVAIGSGIFRTPGDIAAYLHAPAWIVAAWLLGGGIVLMQCLVTAELATRVPRAGGEYAFLKAAYGEFPAFFFGWAYTVFILGGGAALIAAALGDFACELLQVDAARSGWFAAGAIALVAAVNAAGLRVGAGAQNTLTLLKIAALATVIVIGFSATVPLRSAGTAPPVAAFAASAPAGGAGAAGVPAAAAFLAALLNVLWAYDGVTDSAKLAEEIRDVRRAVPRGLLGGAVTLTLLYVLVNLALLRIVPAAEMASLAFVPGEALARLYGPSGRTMMLAVAIVVCLGALSATLLAPIRVTFALARDRLTFSFLSRMSAGQAPVPALMVVAAFAALLALTRTFSQVLQVYYFAAALLFGLTYASLIVLRRREPEPGPQVYRAPAGTVLATLLILVQLAIATHTASQRPLDMLYASGLLVFLGVLYFIWKRACTGSQSSSSTFPVPPSTAPETTGACTPNSCTSRPP